MSELLKLAERCEAAAGPDREIELSIWRIIDPKAAEIEVSGRAPLSWLHRYTGSLDDAMKLVPAGWAIERLSHWPASPEEADNTSPAKASVDLCGVSLSRFGRRMIWGHSGKDGRLKADASTPALALTAAALRARDALTNSEGGGE